MTVASTVLSPFLAKILFSSGRGAGVVPGSRVVGAAVSSLSWGITFTLAAGALFRRSGLDTHNQVRNAPTPKLRALLAGPMLGILTSLTSKPPPKMAATISAKPTKKVMVTTLKVIRRLAYKRHVCCDAKLVQSFPQPRGACKRIRRRKQFSHSCCQPNGPATPVVLLWSADHGSGQACGSVNRTQIIQDHEIPSNSTS